MPPSRRHGMSSRLLLVVAMLAAEGLMAMAQWAEMPSHAFDEILQRTSMYKSNETLLTLFYVPFEGQCRRVLPIWEELHDFFRDAPSIRMLKVDCAGQGRFACLDHHVRIWPSFQRFVPGNVDGEFYKGPRDHYHIQQWIFDSIPQEERGERVVRGVAGCHAFRETADCDPEGQALPHRDRECDMTVPSGISGFCECDEPVGGVVDGDVWEVLSHKGLKPGGKVTCEHEPFTCLEVCLKSRTCVAWRQTGDCHHAGEREPHNDDTCRTEIGAGRAGFCECTAGKRTAEVACKHKPFRCEDMCSDMLRISQGSS